MLDIFLTLILPNMPLNVATAVALLGIGYSVLVFKLQRKLINPIRAKEAQKRLKELQNEIQALAKSGQNADEKQREFMALMKENMNSQMKSMFVILPVFFVVYYGLLPALFDKFSIEFFNLVVPLGYAGLFIVTVIVAGIALVMIERMFVAILAKRSKSFDEATAK